MADKDFIGLEPSSKLLSEEEKQQKSQKMGKNEEEDVDTGRGLAKSLTLMNGVSMIVGYNRKKKFKLTFG
jgi:hypothetical protein